jgi:hypothetical protein
VCHALLRDTRFFELLTVLDYDLADQARVQGCPALWKWLSLCCDEAHVVDCKAIEECPREFLPQGGNSISHTDGATFNSNRRTASIISDQG